MPRIRLIISCIPRLLFHRFINGQLVDQAALTANMNHDFKMDDKPDSFLAGRFIFLRVSSSILHGFSIRIATASFNQLIPFQRDGYQRTLGTSTLQSCGFANFTVNSCFSGQRPNYSELSARVFVDNYRGGQKKVYEIRSIK